MSSRRSFSCSSCFPSHGDLRAVSRPAVMPQCARRWCGLPPQSPVLSCTPGSQTIVLAVPSDRTDGVCGHTADSAACRRRGRVSACSASFEADVTGCVLSAWPAKLTSTCPRGVALGHEDQGWSLVAGRGGHVSRRFDLSRPTFVFFE